MKLELHKTYHAATEFVIITNFRNHPLNEALKMLFFVFPSAILGVSPAVIVIYSVCKGFLVLMQHSEMDWRMPFIEKYIFIGSKGHRIHHSTNPIHQNKNLGYLVLWDRLFGTFYYPEPQEATEGTLTYGIRPEEDIKTIHNSPNLGSHFFGVYIETLIAFGKYLGHSVQSERR